MRFVFCGEALIDMLPIEVAPPRDAPVAATTTTDTTPDTFETIWSAQSAGSPMNTAIAFRLLGHDPEFLGRLSTDAFGRQLADHVHAYGLGTSLVTTTPEPTSLAVVSLDEQRKATYTFHFADTANFGWRAHELPDLAADDFCHLGSLATVVAPGAAVLREWLARQPCPFSLDLNVRPTVQPDAGAYWRDVRPWLELAATRGALVKASDDDVAFLGRGSGHGGSPVDVAAAWVRELGMPRFVVTLGAHGAASAEADGRVLSVPGRHVEVADTVAAGDTFMASLIDRMTRDGDIVAAMEQAVAASSIVVTRVGCQPPTRPEVDALLRG